MITALNEIEVITLFVEDLAATRAFYAEVFGSEIVFEDDVSAVLVLGPLMVNLLQSDRAPELIEPSAVASATAGARALYTIRVDDVNAVCFELQQHGVSLLNGPVDRPWGRRTASFADPAGNVWEVAQILADA